jgi:hypothetical protein
MSFFWGSLGEIWGREREKKKEREREGGGGEVSERLRGSIWRRFGERKREQKRKREREGASENFPIFRRLLLHRHLLLHRPPPLHRPLLLHRLLPLHRPLLLHRLLPLSLFLFSSLFLSPKSPPESPKRSSFPVIGRDL